MIINLCLFIFLGYLGWVIYKMLNAKPTYRTKYTIKTPKGNIKITYDEK